MRTRHWIGLFALCSSGWVLAQPAPVLPPYEFAAEADERTEPAAVVIQGVAFTGNRVIDAAALQATVRPYLNRPLQTTDLQTLRDQITRHYVDAGYLSSGAQLGSIDNGILNISLLEKPLSAIKVTTNGRYRPLRLQRMLQANSDSGPFNIFAVERQLQLLMQDPNIEQLDARVEPGSEPGEAMLYVEAAEVTPWSLQVGVNNHQSTAVGDARTDLHFRSLGPLGLGDALLLDASYAEGLREAQLAYSLPLTAAGTTLTLSLEGADTEVVAEPFAGLDIEAESRSARLTLSRPLWRDLRLSVEGFVSAEVRRSETFLLGQGFSFVAGPDEGEVDLTVVRAGAELLWRGGQNVFAARLAVAKGLSAFGATEAAEPGFARGDSPDPEFLSYEAQFQWGRRMSFWNSQWLLRGQLQLAEDPLFGMMQSPIGGRHSVRGYRENTLIRDSAVGASVEWRIPLWADVAGRPRLELGPFFDWSHSWNVGRDEVGPSDLKSVGIGLSWRPTRRWWLELQWGHALDRLQYSGQHSLTDDGLHLSLQWSAR